MTKPLGTVQNRYEVRFVNGFWTIFDTVWYTPVEKCFTKKEADELLAR